VAKPPGNSLTFEGCIGLILLLFVLGILLILGLLFLFLIQWSWPWCLLVFPLIIGIVLLRERPIQKTFAAAFRRETVDAADLKFRHVLMVACLVVSALTTIPCWVLAGSHDFEFWLIPISAFATGLQLYRLSILTKLESRLFQAFLKNAVEFLSIATTVLAFYSALIVCFWCIPLESTRLGTLTHFECEVERLHKVLEQPIKVMLLTLACVLVLWLVRIGVRARPQWNTAAEKLSWVVSQGLKWLSRVSAALSIAVSFTLLATDDNGPLKSIGIALRDSRFHYENLQAAIRPKAGRVLKEELAIQLLSQRPGSLQNEMTVAERLWKDRNAYRVVEKEAKRRFLVIRKPQPPRDMSITTADTDKDQVVEGGNLPAQITLDNLKSADQEAIEFTWKPDKYEPEYPLDDVSAKGLEELTVKRIFEAPTMVSAIAARFPILGEVLNVFSSTISEQLYRVLRDSVVKKSATLLAEKPDQDIEAVIRAVARNEITGTKFKWAPIEGEVSNSHLKKIEQDRSELASDRLALEKDAQTKANELFAEELREARIRVSLLSKVAQAIEDQRTKARARLADEELEDIAAVGKQWPALTPPTSEQSVRMNRLVDNPHYQPIQNLPLPEDHEYISLTNIVHSIRKPGQVQPEQASYASSAWIEWGFPNPGSSASDLIRQIDNLLYSMSQDGTIDKDLNAQLKDALGNNYYLIQYEGSEKEKAAVRRAQHEIDMQNYQRQKKEKEEEEARKRQEKREYELERMREKTEPDHVP